MFWAETAANLVRLALDPALDAGSFPYHGSLRVAFYADHAAFLVFSLATCAAIAAHYAGLPPRRAAAAWLATSVAFVVWKEWTWLPSIEFHEWVVLAATVVAFGLVMRAALAPDGRLVRPDTGHAALALLLCNDIVHVTVFRIDGLLDAWPSLRAMDLAVYGLLLLGYCALYARDWRARWLLRRT